MKRTLLFVSIAMLLAIFPLCGQVPPSVPWDKLVMAAKVDITGDGKTESIQLIPLEEPYGGFSLRVNNKEVVDELFDPVDGFYIVDISRDDKYKEIVVHTPGPSDDDEHMIFWFDGQQIRKIGTVSRWPEYLGNGIVLVKDWSNFWVITEKYVLTKDRTLAVVPQEFYAVGVKATVGKPLTLYQRRNSNKVLATLRVRSKAEILLNDGAGWYLVKSEHGLLGWSTSEQLYSHFQDLPLAD